MHYNTQITLDLQMHKTCIYSGTEQCSILLLCDLYNFSRPRSVSISIHFQSCVVMLASPHNTTMMRKMINLSPALQTIYKWKVLSVPQQQGSTSISAQAADQQYFAQC